MSCSCGEQLVMGADGELYHLDGRPRCATGCDHCGKLCTGLYCSKKCEIAARRDEYVTDLDWGDIR